MKKELEQQQIDRCSALVSYFIGENSLSWDHMGKMCCFNAIEAKFFEAPQCSALY